MTNLKAPALSRMRTLLWMLVPLVLGLALVNAQPSNDNCEGAVGLSEIVDMAKASRFGSTDEATPEELGLCGVTAASKRGVWYLYQNSSIPEGSTRIVTATTCNDLTDFDTALTLYEGFCEGLSCVHGADNDTECGTGGGTHTTLSWHAETGTRYYLLVHGSQVNHTGNFELTVTTEEPLAPVSPGELANSGAVAKTILLSLLVMASSVLFVAH